MSHNTIAPDVEVAFRHDPARVHMTLIFGTTTCAITFNPKHLQDARVWLKRASTLIGSPLNIGMARSTVTSFGKALEWLHAQAEAASK